MWLCATTFCVRSTSYVPWELIWFGVCKKDHPKQKYVFLQILGKKIRNTTPQRLIKRTVQTIKMRIWWYHNIYTANEWAACCTNISNFINLLLHFVGDWWAKLYVSILDWLVLFLGLIFVCANFLGWKRYSIYGGYIILKRRRYTKSSFIDNNYIFFQTCKS